MAQVMMLRRPITGQGATADDSSLAIDDENIMNREYFQILSKAIVFKRS